MAVSRRMWLREQERKKRERQRRARRRRQIAAVLLLSAAAVIGVLLAKGRGGVKVDDPVSTAEAVQTRAPAAEAAEPVDAEYFDNSVFIGGAAAAGIDSYGILPYTDFYAGVNITLDNCYTTAAGNDSMSVVDQLKSKKFGKVFIFFGETELAQNDAASFARSYKALVEKVKSYQQSASVYVISIPPVEERAEAAGYSLGTISSYNRRLKMIAAEEKVYYVDSFEALGGDHLPAGTSSDGVNMNKTCCAKLLNYIRKNAGIPSLSDISDEDGETVRSDTAATDKPEPTINVFKNSAGAD